MDVDNFRRLCKLYELSEEAIKVINQIRTSPPARKVSSSRGNLSGFYSSKKMGVTIQFESHTLELPRIYLLEHDSKVYQFFDQPSTFPIRYIVNGKRRGHMYTPDFFIISEDFIGWQECKTEEQLEKLSKEHPERYIRNEEGNWDMPPAREYADQLGFSFKVWTDKEIDWVFQSNLHFLEDYLLEETLIIPKEISQNIQAIVKSSQGISLKDLLTRLGGKNSDEIYMSLVLEDIYIDLFNERLTEWDYVKVYSDKTVADNYSNMRYAHKENDKLFNQSVVIKAGNKILWDGRTWTILNHGEMKTTLLGDQNERLPLENNVFFGLIKDGEISNLINEISFEDEILNEILTTAGPKDHEIANTRFNVVFPIVSGEKTAKDFDIPDRTIRDWLYKYNKGEKLYGNGFLGLFPDTKNQGNRIPRFSEEILELIEVYVKEYETNTNKGMKSVWRSGKEDGESKNIYFPSYQTFSMYVNARPIYEQTKNREGSKAANKHKPFYYELEYTTSRHGERPFEIVHIDHTELDLEMRCSKTGKSLGRPWITFMVDAFTRRILAFYLSFYPPSHRSCMMVIRECVKKHGRMPDTFVVDGGKEFGSIYFDSLLATHKCNKKERKGQPRFGSVIDRLFGVTNEMFIHNLLGNTQVMKNVRQVTPDVNPKKHSVWTLSELTRVMAVWTYDVYDTIEHIALGESPRDAQLRGIAKTGDRSFTMIAYNENFKMQTLPSTNNKTLKVYPGRGIKMNYIYYSSPALKQPGVENTQVPIRYDPYNVGVAYAFVKGKWISLRSEHYLKFLNRTEMEIQIVTEELKKRTRNTVKAGNTITASKIASFLMTVEGKQVTLMQRLLDVASQEALLVLDGDLNEEYTEIAAAGNNREEMIERIDNNNSNETNSVKRTKTKSNREVKRQYISYEEMD